MKCLFFDLDWPCAKNDNRNLVEGSLEAKLLGIWTDGTGQPGRSSDMENVRTEREKIRDGEDEKGRKSEVRCGVKHIWK